MVQVIQPKVFLIGETVVVEEGLQAYLDEIGAPEWTSDAQTSVEKMPEIMGRVCYRSFAPGLNANVTSVREGNATYIANVIGHLHGSVLEHSTVNFIFHNVSRVVTHELVRHRAGVAISQESLRFVRLDKLNVYIPKIFTDRPAILDKVLKIFEYLEEIQIELAEEFGLDSGILFALKKIITSALRRLAPMGLATTIGWGVNMRAIRHIIEARTSSHAEEEIRVVFGMVAEMMAKRYPNLFFDMHKEEVDGFYQYTFENSKV